MGLLDRLRGRKSEPPESWVYPLNRTQERTYGPGFEGDIFVWDIDKTYLSTEFDSLAGVLKIPLERGIDKKNIAGTDVLLRALRRGPPGEGPIRSNPLYFVSASPPQLRSIIERKMVLDGVEYDGITFKDQVGLIRAGRMGKITAQVGYKVAALLLNRRELPWNARETLFGDDSEADALIYALYSDIVAGRLRDDTLYRTLLRAGTDEEDATYITRLATDMKRAELVHRIYINLEKRTAPVRFHDYGPRLVPCYDTFQMALHLFQDEKIPRQAVLDVGRELLNQHRHQPLGLLRGAFDLIDRGILDLDTLRALWPDLERRHLLPPWVALKDGVEAHPARVETPGAFVTPTSMLALT